MVARKPEAPFAWLVVYTVPEWPQIGPPDDLKDGPGRTIVERDGGGKPDITSLQEGRAPERLHQHHRMAEIREQLGPNRSDLTVSPIHRDEYFGLALGLAVGDAHPVDSAADVAWDTPAWFGALRDGAAWANMRGHKLLPTLGRFFPKGPPTSVAKALGDTWADTDFGLVLVELPSLTAHTKLAVRGRLLADMAVFEAWVRKGRRQPSVFVDV